MVWLLLQAVVMEDTSDAKEPDAVEGRKSGAALLPCSHPPACLHGLHAVTYSR
jgi:hypothetical protein